MCHSLNTAHNQINKIHKHMIYEMEDASWEDLLLKYSKQMVPKKLKNLDNIEDFKRHIKDWKSPTCSCKLCL